MLFKSDKAEARYNEVVKDWTSKFYEGGILRFAQRYAAKMEEDLLKLPEDQRDNAAIAATAKRWQYDADTEGITGFMYNCAIRLLVEDWKYGEGLRIFHNIDTDPEHAAEVNEKGGLMNGAILTVSTGTDDDINPPAIHDFRKDD